MFVSSLLCRFEFSQLVGASFVIFYQRFCVLEIVYSDNANAIWFLAVFANTTDPYCTERAPTLHMTEQN